MPHGRYREGRKGKSGEDSEDSEEIDVDMGEAREDRKDSEDRDVSMRDRSRSRSPPKSHHKYGPFDLIYDKLVIKIKTQRSFHKDYDSIVKYIYKEYKTIVEKEALSIANTVLRKYGNDRTKHAPYLEELVTHWLDSNNKPHFKAQNITLWSSEVEQLKKEILEILNNKIEEQIEKQKQQQQLDSIHIGFANLGKAKGVKAKYNNTYRRHKKTRRHHYKKTHRRRYRK